MDQAPYEISQETTKINLIFKRMPQLRHPLNLNSFKIQQIKKSHL